MVSGKFLDLFFANGVAVFSEVGAAAIEKLTGCIGCFC
jgi:hypothetical protein